MWNICFVNAVELRIKATFFAQLAQPWDGDGMACSQHHCACNSIDVISNLSVPPLNCLFSLRFLNLQATDCDVQLFLLFAHHVESNRCSHPQILSLAHTILLCQKSHPGERKSHIYSCTPISYPLLLWV